MHVLAASEQTVSTWEKVVHVLEGRAAVQRDWDRPEKWAARNLTAFSDSAGAGMMPFTSTRSGPTACKAALQERT